MDDRAECFREIKYADTYRTYLSKVIGDDLEFSIPIFIVLPILLLVAKLLIFAFLYKKSMQSLRQMIDPSIQPTFSILNYYQVVLIQIQIVIIFLKSLLHIAFFGMG